MSNANTIQDWPTPTPTLVATMHVGAMHGPWQAFDGALSVLPAMQTVCPRCKDDDLLHASACEDCGTLSHPECFEEDEIGRSWAHEAEDGSEWIFFETEEAADAEARRRYVDAPEDYIDSDTLAEWALDAINGGYSVERQFERYLEDLDRGQELARYDGDEIDLTPGNPDDVSPALIEALGFAPTLAYRVG